ncbi:endonuclease/exonuclease/phosphatase family protein [Parafrankia elaeagni]|uniref:endonuclease/exonuclease/phosphatase family protein n=1 Tax=Parafrankia elaeagni TaxID=222534 RepID=UPI000380CBF5|nr:endonuclease/exonuclease/phosphatase family protein [Parafrankia elaeagni]
MPTTYYLAWWNLENLFDEENSPRRTEKLTRTLGDDLAGWTPQLRDRKISQLASVIAQMNGGAGPDLLGVCEVENRFVLELLAAAVADRLDGRRYEIVHADTDDARGIDVAFLYDPALFTAPAGQVFFHVVMRRNATREIVQVNFQTRTGRTWAVFGNHWPSRSGGQFESAGYRAIAGETLAYFHQRVREEHGEDTPALAMGDFNDEPFDTSLVAHALSTRQPARVINADTPRFWNLMWPAAGAPEGTFYFQNEPNLLDQFLVNANMAHPTSPLRANPDSVQILRFPELVHTGDYPRPRPFGGMGATVDETGYSDHFPIGMTVTETG